MNTPTSRNILQQEHATTASALELFDELDPVDTAFMLGRWKGSGWHTGHKLDGLLETFNWYGKEFISAEQVHPLLFADGDDIFKVDPNPTLTNLGFNFDLPRNNALKPIYSTLSKLLKTEESKARLRMLKYRGKVSATMMYDYLPINDVFAKVDENTVLGLMDCKGMSEPFFFTLERV